MLLLDDDLVKKLTLVQKLESLADIDATILFLVDLVKSVEIETPAD